jgi:hypothetical protein
MSGYGLPDPYGLLDGEPQVQVFLLENAKIILKPLNGWFNPRGKQVSFCYDKIRPNAWPVDSEGVHPSSMGMFAGNGAPISNVSFIIVSRFPLQDFELTGHDDASKFVSNINGSIEKIAHKISGGSVNYIGPDRLKPCIPYVLPALLNGILTDREWVQGAQKINTAWRTYYDSNNYFCLLTKERLLREIGAVLVLFLLAGLSSIKGVVGTIFGILTIVYLIGLLCVLIRLMGGREIMRTQPMWRVLKEVHENTFSRKVKISWTPAGSFGRRKSGIAGTGTRYVIEKFCVEILRNGHANGQPQMVIGQQTMLQPQMVTFANE